MEYLIGVAISACMVIPLVAASVGVDRDRTATLWALLFLGLVILDQALLYLPIQTGIDGYFGLHWNWFGKLFVLAWAVPFIVFGPISVSDVGLRAPLRHAFARAAMIVAILAIVAFLVHWFMRTGEPRTAGTVLFQLIMPAIAEELVFRGVLFAVLQKAFREPPSADPKWWKSRAVWLTAIAFALIHGWTVVGGTLEFNALACISPFVFGVIAGALRKYSGSVAFPIVLHSAVDVAAAVFP